jgi:hypothetical protein
VYFHETSPFSALYTSPLRRIPRRTIPLAIRTQSANIPASGGTDELHATYQQRAFDRDRGKPHSSLQPLAEEKTFRSFLRSLFRQDWIVYAKPPFGGPEYVLHDLARYTHRVAISNHRLVDFADGKVTFRWKDYSHGGKHRVLTLPSEEFLRRFLIHTLPPGFIRIRFFGFLANRRRATSLVLCRQLLDANPPSRPNPPATAARPTHGTWTCPLCGGPMIVVERLTAQQISWQSAQTNFDDTS